MRPISISLSPNTEPADIVRTLFAFLMPWRYRSGPAIRTVERWFEKNFQQKRAFSFMTARGGLYYTLKAWGVGAGDEVILQALTCVAVPEAIVSLGGTPVYVDTFKNHVIIDADHIAQCISKKTKALIIQHTFGIKPDREKIISLCKKHKLLLIEDCAHIIDPNDIAMQLLNRSTIPHAFLFSFGRDKAISSVFGGVIATNTPALINTLRMMQRTIPLTPIPLVITTLLHPLWFALLVLPLYKSGIGKLLLKILLALRFIPKAVWAQEKNTGTIPPPLATQFPNALATLALAQLEKIGRFNNHRRALTELYSRSLKQHTKIAIQPYDHTPPPLLRFPLLVKNAHRLNKQAMARQLYLGDWYEEAIAPAGVNFKAIGYTVGSCPNAEDTAHRIINLPTHINISEEQANSIVNFINAYTT